MNSVIQRTITGGILAAVFFGIYFFLPAWCLSGILVSLLGAILIHEWPALVGKNKLVWLVTPLYPIVPFILMIMLNESPRYHPLILYLFTLVPLFDTGSYIFGKLWGKHKIMPQVSPGKTWQGFLGGWLSVWAALLAIMFIQNRAIAPHSAFLVASIISILALLGDLLESWFKRRADLKDSGSLLPGHGGLLDRFDSIMTTGLFFYLCKEYLLALLT